MDVIRYVIGGATWLVRDRERVETQTERETQRERLVG